MSIPSGGMELRHFGLVGSEDMTLMELGQMECNAGLFMSIPSGGMELRHFGLVGSEDMTLMDGLNEHVGRDFQSSVQAADHLQ